MIEQSNNSLIQHTRYNILLLYQHGKKNKTISLLIMEDPNQTKYFETLPEITPHQLITLVFAIVW